MRKIGKFYIRFLKLSLVFFAVLNSITLIVYWHETSRLSTIANKLTTGDDNTSEKIETVARYVTNIESVREDDGYFLLPVFAPLKPSAYQVIDEGGDCAYCAYRARAFIVLLKQLDIRASKLCLHDGKGIPRHAVTRVDTDRGALVVDLLFGIIYAHDDGTPMSLDYIGEHHAEIIDAEVRRGNTRAERYPLQRYPFEHVTTINWEKGPVWRWAHAFLRLFMTDQRIDNMGRPYLSEEPALMIVVASVFFLIVLLIPIVCIRIIQKLRGKHRTNLGTA